MAEGHEIRAVRLSLNPAGVQSTGEALVTYYINRIRFVRPSVRPFVRTNLDNRKVYMDMLYMDRTGIYPDGFLYIFRARPTDRPDATVRKPDTVGKKR